MNYPNPDLGGRQGLHSSPGLDRPATCQTCGSDDPDWTVCDGDKLLWEKDSDFAYCPDLFHIGRCATCGGVLPGHNLPGCNR